jgi:diacylglycerol kinase
LDGIVYAVRHERNVKIHFVAAVAVLVACLVLPLDPLGVLMVLGATSLVLVAELINTAIESVVNMTIQGHHPLARIAKDVAAAAVLVSAFFSLGVAWHVLLPAVAGVSWELQGSGWSRLAGDPVPLFWLGGILLALGLVVALAGLLAIPFAAMVSRRHVHTGIHGWPQVLGGATLGVLLSLCLHLAARKVVP